MWLFSVEKLERRLRCETRSPIEAESIEQVDAVEEYDEDNTHDEDLLLLRWTVLVRAAATVVDGKSGGKKGFS